MTLFEAQEKLRTYGQEHVLKYYEELNEEAGEYDEAEETEETEDIEI